MDRISMFIDTDQPIIIFNIVYGNIGTVIAYNIICWCSWQMWRELGRAFKLAASSTVDKKKSLSRQINLVLVVQAVTPLVLEFVPATFLTAGAAVAWLTDTIDMKSVSSMVTVLLSWAPVINALSVIVIIKPYRRAVFEGLRIWKPKRVSQSVSATRTLQ